LSEDVCSVLREIVELIASIYIISETNDQVVKTRLSDLQSRLDSLITFLEEYCDRDCYERIIKLISSRKYRDEDIDSILIKIHECMINYGCRSNVSIVE